MISWLSMWLFMNGQYLPKPPEKKQEQKP
jgi:hypothetical protein